MKFRNWFWGLFFIVAAVAVIVNQLGYFTGVSLFNLVCTILLMPIILKSIYHLNFAGILFPIAILCILYAEPLGITNLTPWPVLATALLGTIGLSFIFKPRNYHHSWCDHQNGNEDGFQEVVNAPDTDAINFEVSFGSSIKYVNTDNFKKANIGCRFGATKVYFDHAKVNEEGAEINLDVSFSGVELYIPRNWNVVNRISTSLGGVEEKHSQGEKSGPLIIINGKVSFAGVEIIYI